MKTKEEMLEEKKNLEIEFDKIQQKIDRLPDSKLHLLRGLCKDQQEIFNKIKTLDFMIKRDE